MAAEVSFYMDESTARMTPDALRVMLNQNGLHCTQQRTADGLELVLDDNEAVLKLGVEDDLVTGITVQVTFADEQSRLDEICELLESMGWVEG